MMLLASAPSSPYAPDLGLFDPYRLPLRLSDLRARLNGILGRSEESGISDKSAIARPLLRAYTDHVDVNPSIRIGVLRNAARSRNAISNVAFLSSGVSIYGRPGGRSRKARRCIPGTPTPVPAAHPIGVWWAVHNLNRRMPTMNNTTQITPFVFDSRSVRTTQINGEPWFVATDVTDAIGIDRTQTRRLDDDEKGVYSIHTPSGDQEMLVINESGLYSLILRSRKPEAKRFKRWVTHEVLPAIRKTGRYESQPQGALLPDHDLSALFNLISSARWIKKYWMRMHSGVAGLKVPEVANLNEHVSICFLHANSLDKLSLTLIEARRRFGIDNDIPLDTRRQVQRR